MTIAVAPFVFAVGHRDEAQIRKCEPAPRRHQAEIASVMPTSVPCLSDRCSDSLSKPREELSGFTWAGLYEARSGAYVLEMMAVPKLTLCLVLLRVGQECGVFYKDLAGQACRLRKTTPLDREPGQVVLSGALHQRLVVYGDGLMRFPVLLPNAGRYMLFTEHAPAEHVLRIPGLRLVRERYFGRRSEWEQEK